jgi:hypothetical protein
LPARTWLRDGHFADQRICGVKVSTLTTPGRLCRTPLYRLQALRASGRLSCGYLEVRATVASRLSCWLLTSCWVGCISGRAGSTAPAGGRLQDGCESHGHAARAWACRIGVRERPCQNPPLVRVWLPSPCRVRRCGLLCGEAPGVVGSPGGLGVTRQPRKAPASGSRRLLTTLREQPGSRVWCWRVPASRALGIGQRPSSASSISVWS